MTWLERVSAAPLDGTTQPIPASNAMKLGHNESYDTQLRELASVHTPRHLQNTWGLRESTTQQDWPNASLNG